MQDEEIFIKSEQIITKYIQSISTGGKEAQCSIDYTQCDSVAIHPLSKECIPVKNSPNEKARTRVWTKTAEQARRMCTLHITVRMPVANQFWSIGGSQKFAQGKQPVYNYQEIMTLRAIAPTFKEGRRKLIIEAARIIQK